MSKSLKKKSHWTSKVHESVIGRNPEGQLGFELKGGAENGQFPYLGEVKPGKVAYESGSKLVSEELLLEVNETPVAGLTIRDVLAVIKHCKDPLRLKCVKQGGGHVSEEELEKPAGYDSVSSNLVWKKAQIKPLKFSSREDVLAFPPIAPFKDVFKGK
ncbi:Membrane-associated guanylate kinase; WW and PDZ domain-containing protein 2 [Camelus dromedarius]|uniref:Membrane-associated guanylate kinase n=1 Tax=Camelus dromedarius TaxID=9838 RepID=A0A5N4DYL1_CAMDR|nr:Membrane-associated guanylate kinase; WW and PDZ domain-containing protein 2 [Camelus dromedarius]